MAIGDHMLDPPEYFDDEPPEDEGDDLDAADHPLDEFHDPFDHDDSELDFFNDPNSLENRG